MADARAGSRRLLALATTVATLVLPGCFAEEPGLTMGKIMEEDWVPGTHNITGRITEVRAVDGRTWLALDDAWDAENGADLCGGVYAPDGHYAVGDRYRGTITFVEGTWDGNAMVWSPEVPCPFPHMTEAISHVLARVSWAVGGTWIEGHQEQDRSVLEVVTRRGGTFDPGLLNISVVERVSAGPRDYSALGTHLRAQVWMGGPIDSLEEWIDAMGMLFVDVSDWTDARGTGDFTSVADQDDVVHIVATTPLDQASADGDIHWTDHDQDGRFGTGDRLGMRLPARPGQWASVFLVMEGCRAPACPGGVHLMQLAPDGSVLSPPVTGLVQFHVDSVAAGEDDRMHATVGRTVEPLLDVADIEVLLDQDGTTRQRLPMEGSVDGITWSFEDGDGDGRVTTGDAFRAEWTPSAQPGRLQLRDIQRNEFMEEFDVGPSSPGDA